MAFEEAGCLQHLEAFCTTRGADFYGLSRNDGSRGTSLTKEAWTVPSSYPFEDGQLVPLFANETIPYKLQ